MRRLLVIPLLIAVTALSACSHHRRGEEISVASGAAGQATLAPAVKTNVLAPVIQFTTGQIGLDGQGLFTGGIAEVEQTDKATRLNFEHSYPMPLTAIVVAAKTNLFPELAKLKGKTITVCGEVQGIPGNHGRLEITLDRANQLKIVDEVPARTP